MTQAPSKAERTECALVLFAKRPKPGVGKQRIAVSEGRDVALALSQRLFDCAVEDLRAWPGPAVICIADAADQAWAQSQLPAATVTTQSAGNLGVRLNAASDALGAQFGRVLFIGCDAPTIDTDYLIDCAARLDQHDVVLGAAGDGGVVAMGTRRGWPPLDALPWSTPALGRALADACTASGLSVDWTAAHDDLDEAAQLAAAARALRDDPRPARRALYAWLTRYLHEAGDAATTQRAQSQ